MVIGRLLLAAVVATAAARTERVESQTGPAAPPRVAEVSLSQIPTTVRYEGRSVIVRYPADPEVRSRGGSGGPMIEIVVRRPGGGPDVVFLGQAIGLTLVRSETPWPAFELWGNAGGGVYTRAVYRWHVPEAQYCATRVDEFEDRGDDADAEGTVRIAGSSRAVRYARSREFACEANHDR